MHEGGALTGLRLFFVHQMPAGLARDKPITAQRAGSMEPIVNTYPQQEGTVFPRELLEFAMYHPDFLDPLDRVFERRRSRRSQEVH